MTAKEKARELRDKMYLKIPAVYDPTGLAHYPIAKEMALIAVDLRLEGNFLFTSIEYEEDSLEYWLQVKHEIEKL